MKPARRVGLVWAIVFIGLEIISYLTYYDRLAEQILIHAAKHRVEEKNTGNGRLLSSTVSRLGLPAFLSLYVGNHGPANKHGNGNPEYIPSLCYEVWLFDDVQFICQKACMQ